MGSDGGERGLEPVAHLGRRNRVRVGARQGGPERLQRTLCEQAQLRRPRVPDGGVQRGQDGVVDDRVELPPGVQRGRSLRRRGAGPGRLVGEGVQACGGARGAGHQHGRADGDRAQQHALEHRHGGHPVPPDGHDPDEGVDHAGPHAVDQAERHRGQHGQRGHGQGQDQPQPGQVQAGGGDVGDAQRPQQQAQGDAAREEPGGRAGVVQAGRGDHQPPGRAADEDQGEEVPPQGERGLLVDRGGQPGRGGEQHVDADQPGRHAPDGAGAGAELLTHPSELVAGSGAVGRGSAPPVRT